MTRCTACDVPLRAENVSPGSDDTCRECDDYAMAEAMMLRGGSFVQALGKAWYCADARNRARLIAAFPDYVAEYRELARLKRAQGTSEAKP